MPIESDSGHCIKFPDGMMIQWGGGSTANTNGYTSIPLYEQFVNTEYSVSVEFVKNGNTIDDYWLGDAGGNDNRRTDGFDLFVKRPAGTTYTVVFTYIAVGKWK